MEDDEEKSEKEKDKLNYEILIEDFSYFDLSFKIIVIGNSGKNYFIIIK